MKDKKVLTTAMREAPRILSTDVKVTIEQKKNITFQ